MQIKLDDEILYEIDETMLKLLAHDLIDPIAEIKRRLHWIIDHKCERCYERMEQEYKQILINDPTVTAFPKDRASMVDLITNRADYKTRAQREAESNGI